MTKKREIRRISVSPKKCQTYPSLSLSLSRPFPRSRQLQRPGAGTGAGPADGGRDQRGCAVQHRQVLAGVVALLPEAQLTGAGADGVDDALLGAGLPEVAPTDVAQPETGLRWAVSLWEWRRGPGGWLSFYDWRGTVRNPLKVRITPPKILKLGSLHCTKISRESVGILLGEGIA